MINEILKRLLNNLKSRGILVTLYKIYYYFYGMLFDLKYRTNTTFTSTIDKHGFEKGYGTGNFAAHPSLLRSALKSIPIDENDILVDIGCGKGRALIVAAEFPFKKIIGIDIVEENVKIAQNNMGSAGITNVELIQQDAIKYGVPNSDIWLFFKPFDEKYLTEILDKNTTTPKSIVLVNVKLESLVGYQKIYEYQHPIYSNFNYKIFTKENIL